MILLPTLYFTFSRGAWVALGIGAAALFLGARERLRMVTAALFVLPAPAVAVLAGSRAEGLTHEGALRATAVENGHRLALVLLLLVGIQMLLMLGFLAVERRAGPGGRSSVSTAQPCSRRSSSPPRSSSSASVARRTLVSKGYTAFKAPPPSVGPDLNERLLNFSGNGRADLWEVAWEDFREHRLVGSGAGSYERFWVRERETALQVRDAHGLYVETLAELGPLGLGLLLVALDDPVCGVLAHESCARSSRELWARTPPSSSTPESIGTGSSAP